jgi:hypothetical protein
MPFTGPITLSLSASSAPISHSSTIASPKNWSVSSFSTPGTVGLRKNRWKFNVADQNGLHVGTVTLDPPLKNAMDDELARLAAIRAQITVKVAFSTVGKEDLVVNLEP